MCEMKKKNAESWNFQDSFMQMTWNQIWRVSVGAIYLFINLFINFTLCWQLAEGFVKLAFLDVE